jgi:hypothetical protein
MASRREFLQAGVAASMLPIAATGGTTPEPSPRPLPLYKVIFDRRFSSSREFGAEARRLGLPVHGIEGDITDVWFHDLSIRWKQGPVAIAGLTAHGPLFCLERLAWDHRMRVVFRASHSVLPDGSMEHELWGPQGMVSDASFLAGRTDWGQGVAGLLARCPADRADACGRTIYSPSASAPPDGEPLFSWVIASKEQR